MSAGEVERLHVYLAHRRSDMTDALLRRVNRARFGDELVVYLIDVHDPIGRAMQRAQHARGVGADPANVLRAVSQPPPRRLIISGTVPAALLADLVAQILPELGDLAAKIREPAMPLHGRMIVVAGGGAELVQIPLAAG